MPSGDEDRRVILFNRAAERIFRLPAAEAIGRLGLLGMRERALDLGGALSVSGGPGEGTTVVARFPLERGGASVGMLPPAHGEPHGEATT